jgi:hypothetical protein
MDAYERGKIADALKEISFSSGDYIIKEVNPDKIKYIRVIKVIVSISFLKEKLRLQRLLSQLAPQKKLSTTKSAIILEKELS